MFLAEYRKSIFFLSKVSWRKFVNSSGYNKTLRKVKKSKTKSVFTNFAEEANDSYLNFVNLNVLCSFKVILEFEISTCRSWKVVNSKLSLFSRNKINHGYRTTGYSKIQWRWSQFFIFFCPWHPDSKFKSWWYGRS